MCPDKGPNPQPFGLQDNAPNNWATPPRAENEIFIYIISLAFKWDHVTAWRKTINGFSWLWHKMSPLLFCPHLQSSALPPATVAPFCFILRTPHSFLPRPPLPRSCSLSVTSCPHLFSSLRTQPKCSLPQDTFSPTWSKLPLSIFYVSMTLLHLFPPYHFIQVWRPPVYLAT